MKYINSSALLLLTYTPRKGVNLKEYEEWLIEVDNPFLIMFQELLIIQIGR